MFRKGIVSKETLFTLPKPLDHLFCHLVNIVLERSASVRRGWEHLH